MSLINQAVKIKHSKHKTACQQQNLGGKNLLPRMNKSLEPQSPITLFVRVPSGQTVPICLQAGIQATLADVKILAIQKALPASDAKRALILTHSGRPLHQERASLSTLQIKAYDTIHVQLPLLGGTESDEDQELLKNNPEAYAAKMRAKQAAANTGLGFNQVDFLRPSDDKIEYSVKKEQFGSSEPPVDGVSWNSVVKELVKAFKPSHPYGADFKYKLSNKNGNELDLDEPYPPGVLFIDIIKQYFTEMEIQDNIALIRVAAEKKEVEAYEKFVNDIGLLDNYAVKAQIFKDLTKEQKSLMKQYEENTLTDKKHFRNWLVSLSVDQKENLLVNLAKVSIYKVLEFLLTKNGQWTDISEQVHRNSSREELDRISGRLINKQSIIFDMESEADNIIIHLLQNQVEVMETLWNDMMPAQKNTLLLIIIENDQAANIVEKFIESHPEGFSNYWESLGKNDRLRVWNSLKPQTQVQIPFSQSLQLYQSQRLWDNIGQENRVALWHHLVLEQKKAFLTQMTTHQQISLWNSLGEDPAAQSELFLELDRTLENDNQVQFWRLMSHNGRCQALKHLQPIEMKDLFKSLEIEDKSILLGMVNDETALELKNELSNAEMTELFFYNHFNMREKTQQDKKKFVKDIMGKFYEENNQLVPFAKIEDGYVQCIQDPYEPNGFITVQVVESVSKTNNDVAQRVNDAAEDFYELETDEARKANVKKSVKNDQFRLVENRYGQLQEQEPNNARNAKFLGIISYWQYFEEFGYWCTHSFFAPNPVLFNSINKDNPDWRQTGTYQNVLFKGRNGEIFFFNEKEVTSSQRDKEAHSDLCLQILYKRRAEGHMVNPGEQSRETQENCNTYRIHKDTKLYDYITKGNLQMAEYNTLYFLNAVPTLIEENNQKFIIFSTANDQDMGPATYFYDLQESRTVAKISGAEVFIDYFSHPDMNDEEERDTAGNILVLSNKKLLKMRNWNKKVAASDARFYEAEMCGRSAFQESIIISKRITLSQLKNLSTPEQRIERRAQDLEYNNVPQEYVPELMSGFRETQSTEEEKREEMRKYIDVNDLQSTELRIDETDDRMSSWKFKYYTNDPLHVIVNKRDTETGCTKSFTLLFENNFSLTFSLSDSDYLLKKKEKELAQAQEAKEKEEADKKNASLLKTDKTLTNDQPTTSVEDDKKKKAAGAQDHDKANVMFGTGLLDKQYRAVYFVPDAQFVVEDRFQNKLFVQTCCRQESQFSEELVNDINNLTVYLYNITEDAVKSSTRTRVFLGGNGVRILASRDAIRGYIMNDYRTKFERPCFSGVVSPLRFNHEGWFGAMLYSNTLGSIEQKKLHWFMYSRQRHYKSKIQQPLSQTVSIDYPMMVYKGFTPDNRELVMVNLADKEHPQKTLHLFDRQFISFVGHNYADREAKIGFLTLNSDGDVDLCWLICKQPFEKKEFDSYEDFEIQDTPINFHAPILQDIQKIKRVEFVRLDINDDRTGCLFIQTEDHIYFQNAYTGECKRITNEGPMMPIMMQRGFNSFFYYVEKSATGSDQVIKEVSARVIGGDWAYFIFPIYKITEGSILALELDPENVAETDSIYTHDRELIERREDVRNRLYVLDNNEDINLIVQNEEGSSQRYTVLETKSISQLSGIASELNQFRRTPFNSISVTQRCITLNEINFNFTNFQSWPLNISSKELRGKVIEYIEEDGDSDEDSDVQQDTKGKVFCIFHSVKNIGWTQRQLISMTIQQKDENDEWKSQDLFVTKLLPGTRRQDLVGLRGRRDMDSINFISDDKYLIKFRSSVFSGQQDYWTVVDKNGQIKPLPKHCEDYLTWSSQAAGESRHLESGCLIILRGGEKSVLSMNTDVTAEEINVTMIEFDRNGEQMHIQNYARQRYEASLRIAIEQDLLENRISMTQEGQSGITVDEITKVTQKIEYSDEIFCSKDGDLYRLATIVQSKFDDQVAVNPMPEENYQDLNQDELLIGMYIVRPSDIKSEQSCLKKRQKEMKILVLLCKSEKDRKAVKDAGFVICGDFLCWQYPARSSVNVLDLNPINRLQLTNAQALEQVENETKGFVKHLAQKELHKINARKGQLENNQLELEDTDLDISKQNIPLKERKSLSLRKSSRKKSIDAEENSMKGKVFGIMSDVVPILFDSYEQKEIVMSSPILWRQRKTRIIDLRVMMENENSSHNTKLYDVPNSTQLSMKRVKEVKNKKQQRAEQPTDDPPPIINYNLLQVIVENQAIVFDLEEYEPQEIFLFNATNQFMDQDKYVESGIKMGYNYEDPSKRKDGFLVNSIVSNRDKSAYFQKQERVLFEEIKDFGSLKKTPVCHGMFRGYAEIDLIELQRIQKILENNKKLDNIDMQTVLSLYEGHTVFSIFNNDEKLHVQIRSQVFEGEWPMELQEDETEIQNNIYRRLYRILTIPTPDMKPRASRKNLAKFFSGLELKKEESLNEQLIKRQNSAISNNSEQGNKQDASNDPVAQNEEDASGAKKEDQKQVEPTEDEKNNKRGLYSVLEKSLYIESQKIRDCLMQITNKCDECQISNFAKGQDDMDQMLQTTNAAIIELVSDSFITTSFTRRITNVKWYSEISMVTLRRNSSMLTEEECEQSLVQKFAQENGKKPADLGKTQVQVRLLNIDWLLADKNNFVNFVYILVKNKSEKIYQTELVDVLLEEFWDDNFESILTRCMVPWACYALCSMYFYMTVLQDDFGEDLTTEQRIYEYCLSGLIYIFLIYQVYIEVVQSFGIPFWDYVRTVSNWIDLYTYLLSAYIVAVNNLEIEYPDLKYQRIMAAFGVMLLWIKVFDWFRLFKQTSFYIRLILETIYDIGYFVIIFFALLAMFGCTMFLLQLNVEEGNEDIITPTFQHFLVDSVYNQYMLSVGEFNMDGFDSHPEKILCYIFFLLSTFITQITFLNMLVAIMGDTFGRVIENKANYGLQTKLQIMGDYTAVIQPSTAWQDKNNYLFVIKPQMDGEDAGDQAWEGGLGLIKQSVDKSIVGLRNAIKKELNKVNTQNLEAKARDTAIDKEVRNQYTRISQRFQELEQRTSDANRRFQDQVTNDIDQSGTIQNNKLKNAIQQQTEIQQAQRKMQNSLNSLVKDAKLFAVQQQQPVNQGVAPVATEQNERLDTQAYMLPPLQLEAMTSKINELGTIMEQVISQESDESPLAAPVRPTDSGKADVSRDVEALNQRSGELTSKITTMQSQMTAVISGMSELNARISAFDQKFNQNMGAVNQRITGQEGGAAASVPGSGSGGFVSRNEIQEILSQFSNEMRSLMMEQRQQ